MGISFYCNINEECNVKNKKLSKLNEKINLPLFSKLINKKNIDIEFIPPNDDVFAESNKWKLFIKEEKIPNWFNDAHKKAAFKSLQESLNNYIIKGKHNTLKPGKYILKDAEIGEIGDDVNVIQMENSYIENVKGNCIIEEATKKSIINNMEGNSQLYSVYNSEINTLGCNSKVYNLYKGSNIDCIIDNGQVFTAEGNIKDIYNDGHVNYLSNNGIIDKIHDNAIVDSVINNGIINKVLGKAKVKMIQDNGKVNVKANLILERNM